MKPVRVRSRMRAVRARWPVLDHSWRALVRFGEVHGTLLAAANAFYGFFAAFALGVLAFAAVGWILPAGPSPAGLKAVQDYLAENLPQLNAESLTTASTKISVVAIVGLVFAGVEWIEALRSSQRAIWRLEQQPGSFLLRWLLDLVVLAALGVLLLLSLALSSGIRGVLVRLLDQAEQAHVPVAGALNWTDALLAAGVDMVLAAALLAVVPRLRLPLRRLLPPALLIVLGLGVIKVVGRYFIARLEHNPGYASFTAAAGAVGLLLFMLLLHMIVLYAAALAATNERGTVYDHACRPAAVVQEEPEPTPEPAPEPARNPNLTKVVRE